MKSPGTSYTSTDSLDFVSKLPHFTYYFRETHHLAEAQHRKNERMREAFGLKSKEEGEIKEETPPSSDNNDEDEEDKKSDKKSDNEDSDEQRFTFD